MPSHPQTISFPEVGLLDPTHSTLSMAFVNSAGDQIVSGEAMSGYRGSCFPFHGRVRTTGPLSVILQNQTQRNTLLVLPPLQRGLRNYRLRPHFSLK